MIPEYSLKIWVLVALLATAAVAKKNPIDDYEDANMASLKLHEAQFVKDHNSYQRGDDLKERLEKLQVIELDLYPKGGGDWHVMHDFGEVGLDDHNNCGNGSFKDCLRKIQNWHSDNEHHPLLLVNLDFKTDWLAGSTAGDLDRAIRDYFDLDEIYRPKDLKGDERDVRHAADKGLWSTLGELEGKLMFFITGGAVGRHNQHQSNYLKERIMGDADYKGVAFVCPVVDDYDDAWFKYDANANNTERSGDLDGINKEKRHVACFTAKWDNRKEFDFYDVSARGVLLHMWGVPDDRDSFEKAAGKYRASIIAPHHSPREDYVFQGERDTSSAGTVELYDENGGGGRIVGKFTVVSGVDREWDCQASKACKNDEARSLRYHGTGGVRVSVYDSPSGSHNDDHTRIDFTNIGVKKLKVGSFERNDDKEWIDIKYWEDNGLDGKVSRVKVHDQDSDLHTLPRIKAETLAEGQAVVSLADIEEGTEMRFEVEPYLSTIDYQWEIYVGEEWMATADGRRAEFVHGDDGKILVYLVATLQGEVIGRDWMLIYSTNSAPVLTGRFEDDSGAAVYDGRFFLGQDLNLSASFFDAGYLDTHTMSLDWGDGHSIQKTPIGGSFAVSHRYEQEGEVKILVTVTDDDGASDTKRRTLDLIYVKPVVSMNVSNEAGTELDDCFFPSADSPRVGERVDLSASVEVAEHSDGHSAKIKWGDGVEDHHSAASGSLAVSHVYQQTGVAKIVLTITSRQGGKTNLERTLCVIQD